MKAFLILFKNFSLFALILLTFCFIQSCKTKTNLTDINIDSDTSKNEVSASTSNDTAKINIKSSDKASGYTYTMINLPSFKIRGSVFKQLLTNPRTIVDSIQAEITVDDAGNATVSFYKWKMNTKTAIPGNFIQSSIYPFPLFETGSPLRCKNGLNGVHFTPSTGIDYYLVPDVFTPPGQALSYPRYFIKTSDTYYAPQATAKTLNPIPPGASSLRLLVF